MDNHICEASSFSWLVEIQTVCMEIFFYIQLGQKLRKFFANLRRFVCPDKETNKLPDDKICQQCSFRIHQFAH